jgi:transposase
MLTARKLVQSKLRDVENHLRGILRGFGLKVGHTTARSFAVRIRELVEGQANLETIAQALLAVHAVLLREFNGFERRVRTMAREHVKARLLMTTPAVGPIVALTYRRHRRSVAVQILQARRTTFRADPEEVSIRPDRRHRPDQQDRRCHGAHGAL